MPKVTLVLREGGALPRSEYTFDVAPVEGSSLHLRVDGERHFYRVEEVWHAERSDHVVGYFAQITREDGVDHWTSAEAYVLAQPEDEVDEFVVLPTAE